MKNAQRPKLIPYTGMPVTDEPASMVTILEMTKQQYAGWLERQRICETNAQAALSEREFDKWHELELEADIEATYYFHALRQFGVLPTEN